VDGRGDVVDVLCGDASHRDAPVASNVDVVLLLEGLDLRKTS